MNYYIKKSEYYSEQLKRVTNKGLFYFSIFFILLAVLIYVFLQKGSLILESNIKYIIVPIAVTLLIMIVLLLKTIYLSILIAYHSSKERYSASKSVNEIIKPNFGNNRTDNASCSGDDKIKSTDIADDTEASIDMQQKEIKKTVKDVATLAVAAYVGNEIGNNLGKNIFVRDDSKIYDPSIAYKMCAVCEHWSGERTIVKDRWGKNGVSVSDSYKMYSCNKTGRLHTSGSGCPSLNGGSNWVKWSKL